MLRFPFWFHIGLEWRSTESTISSTQSTVCLSPAHESRSRHSSQPRPHPVRFRHQSTSCFRGSIWLHDHKRKVGDSERQPTSNFSLSIPRKSHQQQMLRDGLESATLWSTGFSRCMSDRKWTSIGNRNRKRGLFIRPRSLRWRHNHVQQADRSDARGNAANDARRRCAKDHFRSVSRRHPRPSEWPRSLDRWHQRPISGVSLKLETKFVEGLRIETGRVDSGLCDALLDISWLWVCVFICRSVSLCVVLSSRLLSLPVLPSPVYSNYLMRIRSLTSDEVDGTDY